ncbi:MAG: BMP family ABC transporter substrate-binding protein [Bdellovibrionales bacterium]|nr:BMP family ABC transporter substrate-binding protein [Bdellovibrionales bacterium]
MLGLLACEKKQSEIENKEKSSQAQQSESTTFKVGLVFDKAGADDKSFNESASRGAKQAQEELGIELKTIEPPDDSAYELSNERFASRGYDLVISVGFIQEEAVQKVAARHPETKFAIIDTTVNLPNVASLMFEEHQGSFLVGMIAAMKSKTATVGFVGGMDIPLIRRFAIAYEAGAKHANPDVKVLTNYAGVTIEAFSDPTKGKELASSQIAQGADVIFAAAGSTGLGVFDAVAEKNIFGIGVDSNQNWIKPGNILTSMLKRVDVAVYETIKEAMNGNFEGGVKRFSLEDKGIDYAIDQYNKDLINQETIDQLEKTKKQIISGELKVPDYYVISKNS